MLKLSINDIISRIESEATFSAVAKDSSFSCVIGQYLPFICATIHNGGNLRIGLRKKMLLDKFERWYEEDPLTNLFISSFPIRIIVHDSRFEYDLNRSKSSCIYMDAWGKQVWKSPLSIKEKNISLEKYRNFYLVIDALVGKLEEKFGGCLVFDFHSYNYRRHPDKETPIINIGTENIDSTKYRDLIDTWMSSLAKIKIPKIKEQIKENSIFYGRGHFLNHITSKFPNTVVLATEIKKLYCDEESGNESPHMIDTMARGIHSAIASTASFFETRYLSKLALQNADLTREINLEALFNLDKQFFDLVRQIDYLDLLNPVNVDAERKSFFRSKYRYNPCFSYKVMPFDTRGITKNLYNLLTENINDSVIENYYIDNIDSYILLLDLLADRNTKNFLYSSIKLFGKPSSQQIAAASNILCNTAHEDVKNEQLVDAKAFADSLSDNIRSYGLVKRVQITNNLAANVVFVPTRNLFKIKKDLKLDKTYASGLIAREVGIRAMCFENAKLQPIRVFQTDTPKTVATQEGLGLFVEYATHNLTSKRLRTIALRTLAIDHMIREISFPDTFAYLMDEFSLEPENAYQICVRCYRGSGLTKDHLYLKGFLDAMKLFQNSQLSEDYLVGKVAFDDIQILDRLKEKNLFLPPSFLPENYNVIAKDHGGITNLLNIVLPQQ